MVRISDNGPAGNKAKRLSLVCHTTETKQKNNSVHISHFNISIFSNLLCSTTNFLVQADEISVALNISGVSHTIAPGF